MNLELQFRYKALPTVSYEVFIHSPDELPYYHSSSYVLGKSDLFTYMSFKIEEIMNEPGVREQTIEDRNCRFVDELIEPENIPYRWVFHFLNFNRFSDFKFLDFSNSHKFQFPNSRYFLIFQFLEFLIFPIFEFLLFQIPWFPQFPGFPNSISTCMFKYRVENEIKHCNCTIPTSPYPDLYKPICGYFQLECLADSRVANKLEKMGKRCLPTCSKMEIHNVGYYEEDRDDEALVLIKLQNRPTLRHVRRINTDKSLLDLVVGVGGIAGLFFGASILSIFEIFYLIFRRN